MTMYDKEDMFVIITGITIIVLCIIGWVANVIQLMGLEAEFTTEFIIKIIGCFVFPLGIVLGWVGIF